MSSLESQLEAVLLLADEPLEVARLSEAVAAPPGDVSAALAALADFYDTTGRGFCLREVAGGWRYYTRPEHAEMLSRWVVEGRQNVLSQAGLETLAVIAYTQPTTRARIGAVRGVNVDSAVRTLLARGLIAETGNDSDTGAGLLTTTTYFLERLGLNSLDDLPPAAPLLPDASALEAELAALTGQSTLPDAELVVTDTENEETAL
ncbi:MAG: SMC-Scp complex subunit ScpB [Propionibacteriaceae bacterium]|jgi:segregation and condensation protein B|nr:SMC-Scp complex subunit ScpB [Propionibacteriaceae bacterium]